VLKARGTNVLMRRSRPAAVLAFTVLRQKRYRTVQDALRQPARPVGMRYESRGKILPDPTIASSPPRGFPHISRAGHTTMNISRNIRQRNPMPDACQPMQEMRAMTRACLRDGSSGSTPSAAVALNGVRLLL